MKPTINLEDPKLVARYRSWVGVLTAFHDFVWENIPEQFLETPQSAGSVFLREIGAEDDVPADAD